MQEAIPTKGPSKPASPVTGTRDDEKGSGTAKFFLELNALTAGLTPEEARRMTKAELDMLADLNPRLVGS